MLSEPQFGELAKLGLGHSLSYSRNGHDATVKRESDRYTVSTGDHGHAGGTQSRHLVGGSNVSRDAAIYSAIDSMSAHLRRPARPQD